MRQYILFYPNKIKEIDYKVFKEHIEYETSQIEILTREFCNENEKKWSNFKSVPENQEQLFIQFTKKIGLELNQLSSSQKKDLLARLTGLFRNNIYTYNYGHIKSFLLNK